MNTAVIVWEVNVRVPRLGSAVPDQSRSAPEVALQTFVRFPNGKNSQLKYGAVTVFLSLALLRSNVHK
jgi:hypothetical protein